MAFTLDKKPANIFQEKYEEAVTLVSDSSFKEANSIFLQLIKADIVLPDAFAFQFGKSLFYSAYYSQSRALIERYEKLTKNKGPHHTESEKLLAKLNNLLNKKEETEKQEEIVKIQHYNESTTCEGHEHYMCPICEGSKVLLKKTNFGQVFTSCEYCDDHGQMNCKDYAKYLNGSLFDK